MAGPAPAAASLEPVPSAGRFLPRRFADFASLSEALDYAAEGDTGLTFYDSRGQVEHALSHAELRSRARRLAGALVESGLPRLARVAIVAETGPDFVLALFACQYAGMVAVPLPAPSGMVNRSGYLASLSTLLETAEARLILGPHDLLPLMGEACSLQPGMRVSTPADLVELHGGGTSGLEPLGGGEISHIQYSSGSTRTPRGIRIDQDALMANLRDIGRYALALRPGDRGASWLPYYHDVGLIGCMLMGVSCQVTLDYLSPSAFARRPLLWLSIMSRNGATMTFSPTFGYDLCVRRGQGAKTLDLDLTSLRSAGSGGEPVRYETHRAFAETFAPYGFREEAFLPAYGLAEATVAVSFSEPGAGLRTDRVGRKALLADSAAAPPLDEDDAVTFVSCGPPLPCNAVEVRDERGLALPERRVGRIHIRGPNVMHGYVGRPDETAEVLDEEGWLDTGDLGYLAEGRIYVTGRRKDLVIVNGRNIPAQDIEWLAEQEALGLRSRDTAAVSIPDGEGGDVPLLLVQTRSKDAEERRALAAAVHGAILDGLGFDCRVELVPPRSLPLTSSGKLSRARAARMYLDGAFSEAEAPPGGARQQAAVVG